MSTLMARMAKVRARVARSTTNDPDRGTIRTTATSARVTRRILICCGFMEPSSLAAKQSGRLDRQDQCHRRVQREIGDFRKQRLTEIVSQAYRKRTDCGAAKRTHASDNDNREGERQHFEIEPGINSEERAADDTADGCQERAERKDEHGDAIGID